MTKRGLGRGRGQDNTISLAEYKNMLNDNGKPRQRRKQKENILQQQIKNKIDSITCWTQANKKFAMWHIPNQRIFAASIASLMKAKKVPLNSMQLKLLNNYLSGFAANLKKAGMKQGAFDNVVFTEGGNAFVFECKVDKNDLTLEQKQEKALLESMGFNVYEVRSLEEFEEILDKEGILTTKR